MAKNYNDLFKNNSTSVKKTESEIKYTGTGKDRSITINSTAHSNLDDIFKGLDEHQLKFKMDMFYGFSDEDKFDEDKMDPNHFFDVMTQTVVSGIHGTSKLGDFDVAARNVSKKLDAITKYANKYRDQQLKPNIDEFVEGFTPTEDIKIPFSAIALIRKFYKEITKKNRTEAQVNIYWNRDNVELPEELIKDDGFKVINSYESTNNAKLFFYVPQQWNNSGLTEINEEDDKFFRTLMSSGINGVVPLLDTHSHNDFGAFWSGIDDGSHNINGTLSLVFGHNQNTTASMQTRITFSDYHFDQIHDKNASNFSDAFYHYIEFPTRLIGTAEYEIDQKTGERFILEGSETTREEINLSFEDTDEFKNAVVPEEWIKRASQKKPMPKVSYSSYGYGYGLGASKGNRFQGRGKGKSRSRTYRGYDEFSDYGYYGAGYGKENSVWDEINSAWEGIEEDETQGWIANYPAYGDEKDEDETEMVTLTGYDTLVFDVYKGNSLVKTGIKFNVMEVTGDYVYMPKMEIKGDQLGSVLEDISDDFFDASANRYIEVFAPEMYDEMNDFTTSLVVEYGEDAEVDMTQKEANKDLLYTIRIK